MEAPNINLVTIILKIFNHMSNAVLSTMGKTRSVSHVPFPYAPHNQLEVTCITNNCLT